MGKSTLARALYNTHFQDFKRHAFIEVGRGTGAPNIPALQNVLLKKISGVTQGFEITSAEEGSEKITNVITGDGSPVCALQPAFCSGTFIRLAVCRFKLTSADCCRHAYG